MRRIRLERPSRRREDAFLAAVRRSSALHGSYVEPPSTHEEYEMYLRRQRRASQVSFLVVDPESDELIGVVNVNEIVRDSCKSGSLGYYAFTPHSGRGYMLEALRRVVGLAFGELRLHRLEASIQPANSRSIGLVEGLGFTLEGTSRRYLKIRGRWRDHQRWALLAEDWRASARSGGSAAATARCRQVHPTSRTSTANVSTASAPAAEPSPSANAASSP